MLSIGRGVAVREVQTSGAEGLTNANEPFGATLEPRVDFSRTELIAQGYSVLPVVVPPPERSRRRHRDGRRGLDADQRAGPS